MMGRPDDPAEKDDGGREIGHDQGPSGRGQAHADQKHRDDRYPEELEDALHPDMDDKPAPVVGHGEMSALAIEKPNPKKATTRMALSI